METAFAMIGARSPFIRPGEVGIFGGRVAETADHAALAKQARAKQLGYADEPFYCGERGAPAEYPSGGHWSRDQEYAAGFAKHGGQKEPREFRLNLERAFKDYEDLTASQYSRLVSATDKPLGAALVDMVAPGKSVEWFAEFAKRNPDFQVTSGTSSQIRHIIETQASDPLGTFTRAGFDALDSGRDVRKLTGAGIRLKAAEFDPAKADSQNILATMATGGLLVPYVLGPSQD